MVWNVLAEPQHFIDTGSYLQETVQANTILLEDGSGEYVLEGFTGWNVLPEPVYS